MAEVGLPLQGEIEFGGRKPWALPTAKIALRLQRVETWLRLTASTILAEGIALGTMPK